MMEHRYMTLMMKGSVFNDLMKMEFFDGTDIGVDFKKAGYIKLNPLVSFYTHLLPIFNDEQHYLAKDDIDNTGMFIDIEDHPGFVGLVFWFLVMDKLLTMYDEDYIKKLRSDEIELHRRNGFKEIVLYDKNMIRTLSNDPKEICEHIKKVASGGFGMQRVDARNWFGTNVKLILFDFLDSDGNVAKTVPYFSSDSVTEIPIERVFLRLQRMVRIFEPEDLELNCLVNCKYKFNSTYIMVDKKAMVDCKYAD